MKFGMNLFLWTDALGDEHIPLLENLKALGFDGVELPMFDPNPEFHAKWARQLDEIGLERTACTLRGVDDNPMSADPKVRAAGVAANKQMVECCQVAGVKVLIGPFHSALGHFSGSPPTEDERRWAADSMREVAEHAAKHDVTLGLEYLNRFECYLLNCAADAARFVEMVDHPNCRLMYDTFHAHIEEKDTAAAIRTVAPHLSHVHISENDRSTPGTGHIDWKTNFDTLREVGYDGWMTIEAFGLALPALAAATKIWRRMYESEEQLARDGLAFVKREWAQRA